MKLDTHITIKGWKGYIRKTNQKKEGLTISTADKTDFRTKKITRDRDIIQ